MDVAAVKSSSIEVSLRSAGAEGLTIIELMAATDSSETTTRRAVKKLVDSGDVHKVPTLDGAKIVWGPKQEGSSTPKVTPRRKTAQERDDKVAEIIRVNQRITMNEIARTLEAPDINQDGWSQLVYVSLQRLRRLGLVEREIKWVWKGPKSPDHEAT